MPESDPQAQVAASAADGAGCPEPAGAGSPLAAIAAAREMAAAADAALQRAVDRARAAGLSWREIGDALETSRQAAFQRFGRPVDPRTGTPMSRTVLPGLADRAIGVFALMAEGRWEEVRAGFGEVMRGKLDQDRLSDGWLHTIATVGNLERMGEPLVRPLGDKAIAYIPLYFEAGERTGQVTFDRSGEVAGLFIRPAQARELPRESPSVPPVEREQRS